MNFRNGVGAYLVCILHQPLQETTESLLKRLREVKADP